MNGALPTILIIFGISGDLARRYLLPAIETMGKAGVLPVRFHVLGITRQSSLRVSDLLSQPSGERYVKRRLTLYQMDIADQQEYLKLRGYLAGLEKSFGASAERIFYLSVPPDACEKILELVGRSRLYDKKRDKILLEKPFGTDLKSARSLIRRIRAYFHEERIYRIDHYLAKEAVQNIIVFRDGNSLFKRTWNKNFIERIEILASETIGIAGRAHFYEQTGALRDYLSSHLLQLAALVLMDLPKKCDLKKVPLARLRALRNLQVVNFRRGQYAGYRDEVKNPETTVETFVSVTLQSSDPKWAGVSIVLATGKAMESRFTEIRIHYKKNEQHESNELLLRIQPDAGIKFSVLAKRPGYERELSPHVLHFSFKDHYGELPEAYEQVLFSAMRGDRGLFPGSREVLESWRILWPVQEKWQKSDGGDLLIYPKGSDIDKLK